VNEGSGEPQMNTNGHKAKAVRAKELMLGYLVLSADERVEFDLFYGKRGTMLEISGLLAKAKPEQLQRVREQLVAWKGKARTGQS